MIEELHQLSQAIGSLKMSNAAQIVEAINRRLESLLHPPLMIKLYWREEAERQDADESGVILRPITFIDRLGGSTPQPFQVRETVGGVLSWAFQSGKTVWLENITSCDLKQAKNKIDGKTLPSEYLIFRKEVDSTIVLPLRVRGEILGVYSFELTRSDVFTPSVLGLLRQLGRSLALIIWDADTHEFNQTKTDQAITDFLDSIRGFSFDPDVLLGENYRAGFVARPFLEEFANLEQTINKILESKGIQARHYEPEGGSQYMIDEIMNRIRHSHFCIADITGNNPNVLAEVGMMMILQKRFLLLKKHGDGARHPFNLSHIPLYEYEVNFPENTIKVWSPGGSRFQDFKTILERFTGELPPETGFSTAKIYSALC